MKALTAAVGAAILLALLATPSFGQSSTTVNGGGQGTYGADLDLDGDVDATHFGLGVTIFGDGSARGHFLCLMAGNADFLGLSVMAVEGRVTSGSVNTAAGTATFSGVASVNLGNGTVFRGVPFEVAVKAGGPGVGTVTLTVIGAFNGVPGDTNVFNNNYDLPLETVTSGQIAMH